MDVNVDQKLNTESDYIGELIKELPNEFDGVSDADFRLGVEKVIENEEFMGREELMTDLVRLLSKTRVVTPKTEVSALKTVLAIENWQKQNMPRVREYRAKKFEKEFVEKTQKKNSKLSDEKIQLIRRKAKLISSVNGKIENQKETAIQTNKGDSAGKIQNSWAKLTMVTGFLGMNKNQIGEVVSKNREISAKLEGVSLPYENFSNLRYFDEIMASDNILNSLKNAPKRLSLIDRGVVKIKQFTGGGDGIIQIDGGFASKIGNQTVGVFVKKSINVLQQNDIIPGTLKIVGGLNKSGINIGMGGLNIFNKSGLVFKNSLENGLTNLGVGIKKFLGNNFGKMGGALVGGLNGIVGAAGALASAIGLAISNPYILAILLVILGINIFQVNTMISEVVPRIETEGGVGGGDSGGERYGEYTNDMEKVPIPGGIIPCNLDTTKYQEELMNKVNAAGFRTRAGVAAAAKYLSSEFEYKIPYYFGGGHHGDVTRDRDGGLVDDPSDGRKRIWGCRTSEDESGRFIAGLDCSGFVTWCYLTAGFKDWEGSKEYRWNRGSFRYVYFGTTDCKELANKVKPGDVLKTAEPAHTGVVLWVEGTIAKYAQSSPRGVNVEFVSLCNGKPVKDSKNSFESIVLMESYFEKNK